MADNVGYTPGEGATIAADDVGGVLVQRVKLTFGGDGVADDVATGNGLPVDTGLTPLTDAQLRASSVPVTFQAVHAEDAPHVSGEYGVLLLAVRSDSDTPTANDGDRTVLKMDEEGRLKVATKPASYPDITGDITAIQATIGTPVAGGTVSGDVSRASNIMAFCTGTFAGINVTFEGSLEAAGDTNWFGIQAVRSNANTIETATGALSAQPVYGWEMSVNAIKRVRVRCTARTSGTQSWRFVQGTYATEPIPAAQISGTQPVSVTAPTASNVNSAASTNATVVKASAGTLYSVTVSNTGAAARYVKFYNKATAPTVGTDVPVFTIQVASGATLNVPFGTTGHRFATGIGLAITANAADSDTTAVGAAEVKVATSYI